MRRSLRRTRSSSLASDFLLQWLYMGYVPSRAVLCLLGDRSSWGEIYVMGTPLVFNSYCSAVLRANPKITWLSCFLTIRRKDSKAKGCISD